MSTLTHRLIASARLDPRGYEEVEADHHANAQAIAVVLLSSLAAALGTGIKEPSGVIALLLVAIASWIIWVSLTLLIGRQIMPAATTKVDFGQLLRTTGFSASPGILRVFGVVPGIGGFVFFAITVWMLLSFVVAVRQALDYSSTWRALAVCLLGWVVHGVIFFGFVRIAL